MQDEIPEVSNGRNHAVPSKLHDFYPCTIDFWDNFVRNSIRLFFLKRFPSRSCVDLNIFTGFTTLPQIWPIEKNRFAPWATGSRDTFARYTVYKTAKTWYPLFPLGLLGTVQSVNSNRELSVKWDNGEQNKALSNWKEKVKIVERVCSCCMLCDFKSKWWFYSVLERCCRPT